MAKIKTFWKHIMKKKLLYSVLLVVVLIVVGMSTFGGNSKVETARAEVGDLVRKVKISGKVIPQEKVELGFETSGTVAEVRKKVGDQVARGEVIVRLDAGGTAANLSKAEAELASKQAEFDKLDGKTVYETRVTNAKRSLVQVMRDAYTNAADAIYNKSDQIFIDPRSDSPRISGTFTSFNDLREKVNKQRVNIGYSLEDWQKTTITLSGSTYSDAQLDMSKKQLAQVTSFISDVTRLVNAFEATSYMPQTKIDQYKSDLRSAGEALAQVSQRFIDSENSLAQSLADVPVQVSEVEAARAAVANLKFQLTRTSLVAPFSGIVAKQDAKVGQSVSSASDLVTVISPDYMVEVYVPEISIAGVEIGNPTVITLDAYGSDVVFPATVSRIDPAETLRDGVSTYKVELDFSSSDSRIRSGMTANAEIETLRRSGVLLIPERSVLRESTGVYVEKLNGENTERVEVKTGERDTSGNVEILSGIVPGETIVVSPK